MKLKAIISIVTIFLINISIQAQDYANGQEKFKHFIGVGAGFTTGYGVSYRYVPDNLGIQFNVAPYYSRNDNSTVSAGITLLDKLKESNDHRLLFYFSNSILYQKKYYGGSYNYIPYYPTYIQPYTTQTSTFNTGVGLDLQFFNNVSPFVFDLMGGFGAYDSFQRITFTGEFALYYKL